MELRWDGAVTPPPQWVRVIGCYLGWGHTSQASAQQRVATTCGCDHACAIHGHDHAAAWSRRVPTADLKGFWGALGCACWAV